MDKTTLPPVANLGVFQKEYKEKRSQAIGRIVYIVALALFVSVLLMMLTGLAGELIFQDPGLGIALFLIGGMISGLIAVVGSYLFVKSLVILAPTAAAVYGEGFVYATFLNRQPQVVRWKQVRALDVLTAKTNRYSQAGASRVYEEVATQYLVKLDGGKQIGLISLKDGEELFNQISKFHTQAGRQAASKIVERLR